MHPEEKTLISRFQGFQAQHGALKDPVAAAADPVAAIVMYYILDALEFSKRPDYHGNSISQQVRGRIRSRAADILELCELANRWITDPVAAAEEDLRELIQKSQTEEAQERQAREERLLREAIQEKANALIATLQPGGGAEASN